MNIHPDALQLVKDFEGFEAAPYQCQAGVWTIGFGSTYLPDGSRVTQDTPPVSEQIAEDMLKARLADDVRAVGGLVTVPLTDRQIGALASLVYNIGKGRFAKSNLLRCLNAGDFDQAKAEWREWRKAGGKVLAGLVKRREAEIELFEKPTHEEKLS